MNNKKEYQEITDLKNAMENKDYDTFKNLFEAIVKDGDKLNALKKDEYFNENLKYFILPMYLKEGYKSFIISDRILFLALQHWDSYLKASKNATGKGYSTSPKEKTYRGGSNSGQFFQWWG
jgi:hypothetical protein